MRLLVEILVDELNTICTYLSGGQSGHEGKTLDKVKNPDEVIDIKPDQCECGCNLNSVEGTVRSRQVFEIPKIEIKVTEYKTYEKKCSSYKKSKGHL